MESSPSILLLCPHNAAKSVVAALEAEGLDVSRHRPRLVTANDLAGAHRVVSLGCADGDLPAAPERLERWDDVPPVSED